MSAVYSLYVRSRDWKRLDARRDQILIMLDAPGTPSSVDADLERDQVNSIAGDI